MDNNIYRYYLTQRPPSPGAIPNKFINAESFDDRTLIGNHKRWAGSNTIGNYQTKKYQIMN